MKLNTALQQNQLYKESFFQEYEQIKKTVLSRYIFEDGELKSVAGPDYKSQTIDDKTAEAARLILERETIAVKSVVMD